jgi:hypothetical protein
MDRADVVEQLDSTRVVVGIRAAVPVATEALVLICVVSHIPFLPLVRQLTRTLSPPKTPDHKLVLASRFLDYLWARVGESDRDILDDFRSREHRILGS